MMLSYMLSLINDEIYPGFLVFLSLVCTNHYVILRLAQALSTKRLFMNYSLLLSAVPINVIWLVSAPLFTAFSFMLY